MDEPCHVAHRKKAAGVKAQKQRAKGKSEADKKKHNPRAFTFSGGHRSVQARAQRTLDIKAKRVHVTKVDKTPQSSPPYTLVVHGPTGVGKTTLIRSLLKQWTKQNLNTIVGPATAVSGRQRRYTILEADCGDIAQLIDLAKIADLAILMVDASFGLQMETFEFLNIMQVHGFPPVLSVLSHLDKIKDSGDARAARKKIKSRLWTEIHEGAKTFNLSGVQHGRYKKTEIANLSRFLAVQKIRPLSWRSSHPYIVSLNKETYKSEEDGTTSVAFYGYVQGCRMREGQPIHIPGGGDFCIQSLCSLPDPCAAPKSTKQAGGGGRALRTLKDAQRAIYAPGCDVGQVAFEEDSMLINLPADRETFTKFDGEECSSEEENELKNKDSFEETDDGKTPDPIKMVRRLQQGEGSLGFRESSQKFYLLDNTELKNDLQYKNVGEEEVLLLSSPLEKEEFEESNKPRNINIPSHVNLLDSIYSNAPHPMLLQTIDLDSNIVSDEAYAGLSDKTPQNSEWSYEQLRTLKASRFYFVEGEQDETEKQDEDAEEPEEAEETEDQAYLRAQKLAEQEQKERVGEIETLDNDGVSGEIGIGQFVKVVVEEVSFEWLKTLSAKSVIILGGHSAGEGHFNILRTRLKRHRWAPKILKSFDPLLFSVGWRRYQALPVYALEDRNATRTRYLKYTPEHMHCEAIFYGPEVPPGTGFVAFRRFDKRLKQFGVSATGTVLESAPEMNVMKKLKLIGEPKKIYRNTCFVTGMFTSDLEVSKFIGAKLMTTSKVRGQIKKASGSKGDFRATFEDQLLPSDLIMCKTWISVKVPKIANPMEPGFRRIRTIGEIKAEAGVLPLDKEESKYGPQVVREPDVQHPSIKDLSLEDAHKHIRIPKSVITQLPFHLKPKIEKRKDPDYVEVYKSEAENREDAFIRLLHQKQEDHKNRRLAISLTKLAAKKAVHARELKQRLGLHKKRRKDKYVAKGKVEAKRREKMSCNSK